MPATTLEEEPQDLKAEIYDVEMDISSGSGSAAGSNKPTTTSSNNSTEEEEIKDLELGGGGYYGKGKKVQLEWHIQQYAVKVKGGEKIILRDIGE
jgi:hypothetical protein